MQVKKVKLFNFGSFVEAEFDLSGQGIVLISGFSEDNNTSNGAGKSTVVEALCWCLFGITPKGLKASDVVNRIVGKNCAVQVDIEDGSVQYRVIRTRDHDEYKNALIFYVNGKEVLGSDNRTTQEVVERYIGLDYQTFTNSVLFPQNSKFKFVQATDAEKKDILSNILNLTWVDSARTLVKNYTDAIVGKMSTMQSESDLLHQTITQTTESIETAKRDIEMNRTNKVRQVELAKNRVVSAEQSIEAALAAAQRQADTLKASVQDVVKTLTDRAAQRTKRLEETIATKKAELDTLAVNAQSVDFVSKLEQLRAKVKVIEGLEEKQATLKQKVADNKAAIASVERTQGAKQYDLKKLTDMQGGQCPTCTQTVGSNFVDSCSVVYHQSIEELNEEKTKRIQDNENLSIEINKLSELIGHRSEIQSKISEVLVAQDRAAQDSKRIVALEAELFSLDSELVSIDADLSREIETQQGRLKQNLQKAEADAKKEQDRLAQALESSRRELSDLMSQDDPIESSLRVNIAKLELRLADTKQALAAKETESNKLHNDSLYLSVLTDMFGNSGLKSFIMDNAIYELNLRVEKYLDKLFDGALAVQFDTLSQTKTGKVKQSIGTVVALNGATIALSQLSGGELKRVSLATDLALSDLIANRSNKSLSLLIFDEATESMDESGRVAFFELLKELSTEKDSIFVVTHDTRLQTQFDKVLQIRKANGISRVVEG